MLIQAITTCVDYDDLLAITIKENKKHFDRWIIITTEEDKATQELCKKEDVECLTTDAFYENDSQFSLARAYNFGFSHLKKEGWWVSLDADTLLPPQTQLVIEKAKLKKDTIYGMRRANYVQFDWLLTDKAYTREDPIYGDITAGYFYLFNSSVYPGWDENLKTAGTTDSNFSDHFETIKVLPLIAFHLGRSNWAGRTSPRFPEMDEKTYNTFLDRIKLVNNNRLTEMFNA